MAFRIGVLAFALPFAGCDCSGDVGSPPGSCTSATDCTSTQMCLDRTCVERSDAYVPDRRPVPDVLPNDQIPGDASCARATGTVTTRPVDVIITIDDSPSMTEEKAAIVANINTNFVAMLEGARLDYHVVMITQDTRVCPGPPLADAATCLTSNARYLRLMHGVNNSDTLTLLLWTYEGTGKVANSCVREPGRHAAWRDFLRPDAQRVFIAFTDDDPSTFGRGISPPSCLVVGGDQYCGCTAGSCGRGPACPNPAEFDCSPVAACPGADCARAEGWGGVCPSFGCPTYADQAAAWIGGRDFPTELEALLPLGTFVGGPDGNWVFHSVVGVSAVLEPTAPLTDRCAYCNIPPNVAENAGVEYQKLSMLTGGLRFPICNTDYSTVFNRIASTITPLACEYDVEPTNFGEPDPANTNVYFDSDGAGPGPEEVIFFTPDVPCNSANGWQWIDDARTRVRLCGDACARVQSVPNGTVRVEVGCQSVIPI